MRAHNLVILAAVCAVMAACSSAPKAKTEFFEVRNKAAEFAKLGDGFMATAQYPEAAKYYDQALRANSSVDYLEGVSASHSSLGRVYLATGDLAAAETEFGSARAYALMATSPTAEAAAVTGQGELRYAKGEKEAALALFDQALALAAKDEPRLAIALHDAAVAKNGLGRSAEAMADLERAAGINTRLKRWTELGANRYVMASILAAGGKVDQALSTALLALAADKAAENGRGIAGDLAACASLASRLGRNDEAWSYWLRSFDTAIATGDAAAARRALVSLVGLAGPVGKPEEGLRYEALLRKLDRAGAAGSAGAGAGASGPGAGAAKPGSAPVPGPAPGAP
ncbi:MAG TPA: hypothetical protein VFL04_07425 [Rectinemataceae bacterium]|nr:hypothetical protein [Rectinemataceae bacterium]